MSSSMHSLCRIPAWSGITASLLAKMLVFMFGFIMVITFVSRCHRRWQRCEMFQQGALPECSKWPLHPVWTGSLLLGLQCWWRPWAHARALPRGVGDWLLDRRRLFIIQLIHNISASNLDEKYQSWQKDNAPSLGGDRSCAHAVLAAWGSCFDLCHHSHYAGFAMVWARPYSSLGIGSTYWPRRNESWKTVQKPLVF